MSTMRLSLYKNLLPQSNSQTTLTLRELVNNNAVLFDRARPYPIWDEKHRDELETKIVDHYAMRQIGFETFGRFKHELNRKMREIMPYYVELYKTTKYEYNPIENYNMEEGSDDVTNSKAQSLTKESDTPQNSIDNLDKYLTRANKNEGESDNTTKHTGYRHGNIGVTSTQQLITQEREIIVNIDMLIIDELETLFLGVY